MTFQICAGETLVVAGVKVHFPAEFNEKLIVVEADKDADIEIVSDSDFRVSNRLKEYFDELEKKNERQT